MPKNLLLACIFLLSFNAAASIVTEPRVALVIGNTHYQHSPLRTASADADAVAGLLANQGFDVIHVENATLKTIEQALMELNTRLGETGTGLFYFAGHGLQTADSVLVLPVDADITSLGSVQRTAISIDRIVMQMSLQRPDQPNVLIIDSCLNNPYRPPSQGSEPEFGYTPDLPENTLVAFATAPGAAAYDGLEHHGLYAQALLNAFQQPDMDFTSAFSHVRRTVSAVTRQQQVPWVLASADVHPPQMLTLEQLSAMPTRGILPQDGDAQYELEFWQSIKDSTDAADFEAYLETYPNGKFAPLAKARAKRYKKVAPPPVRKPAYVVHELDENYEVVRNANIRQTPSSKSRQLGELQRGSTVYVTGQVADKKWYQVRSGSTTGYVFAELLRKPVPKPAPKKVTKPTPRPVKVLPVVTQQGKIEELQDCSSCPVMIALPASNFSMGDNKGDRSERPAHRVSIRKPFAIGKYETTVADWAQCVKAGACSYQPDLGDSEDNSPIRDISWSDAQEYVVWLSTVTHKQYRLPTEAEWEYATRGNTTTQFWWGNKVGSGQADCKNCGGKWNNKAPALVDAFPANPFGLYGTSGGVWEWVADCWHKTYKGAPKDGTAWDSSDCRENMIRGGAWRNDSSYIHSASRFKYDTHVRYLMNGFRVARTLP